MVSNVRIERNYKGNSHYFMSDQDNGAENAWQSVTHLIALTKSPSFLSHGDNSRRLAKHPGTSKNVLLLQSFKEKNSRKGAKAQRRDRGRLPDSLRALRLGVNILNTQGQA